MSGGLYLINSYYCINFLVNKLLFIEFNISFMLGSVSDLVFLDLGTQENEFNNADDETRLIRLPSSFHFGKQNFNTSYVRLSHYYFQ